MAANNELDWLEQRIVLALKGYPGSTAADILQWFLDASESEVSQALSNLISMNYVSADEDLRYVAVGGEL